MVFLQKKRPVSMFKRFFVMTSVTVVLCLTVSCFSLMFFFASYWKNERFTSLSDDALSLARSVETLYDDAEGEFLFSLKNVDSLRIAAGALTSLADSSGTELLVVDSSGEVILCNDCIDMSSENIIEPGKCDLHGDYCINYEILIGAASDTSQIYRYVGTVSDSDSEHYFLVCIPVNYDGNTAGYIVALQSVTEAYLPYTNEFIRMILTAELIAVLMSAVISVLVSYKMVRPLRKVTEITKKYASGNFEERIKSVDTYNELQEFADSFNSMADSLAVIEESRSSFVANVSHELKTPMTIINGFVDGILDGTIPEEDREKYLQIVSEESKRLSRLVVAMLNMSKIEAGKLTLALSDIRLDSMIFDTLLRFEKSINDKKIKVEGLSELEEVTVSADETLINQVIYNLIDNAVKFTSENGCISFYLQTDKKTALLSIKNTGKGIPKEECELVFDRFYKLDKSRGLDIKSFGLGLHIVRSIIELHNGTIVINSEENEYTEFLIRLPLN